jgi:hypothetical protein
VKESSPFSETCDRRGCDKRRFWQPSEVEISDGKVLGDLVGRGE